VSTDITYLSNRGSDQNKKTAEETGDITTGLERFEISMEFVL
jgi:hypothetical protein